MVKKHQQRHNTQLLLAENNAGTAKTSGNASNMPADPLAGYKLGLGDGIPLPKDWIEGAKSFDATYHNFDNALVIDVKKIYAVKGYSGVFQNLVTASEQLALGYNKPTIIRFLHVTNNGLATNISKSGNLLSNKFGYSFIDLGNQSIFSRSGKLSIGKVTVWFK
ncbi:MAG: hypothetical protein EAZ08_13425 [Cytophagales bacterium]|nr:MAG: hypothetical protein EAZ08_13425 [Cytophagales bacterium]